MPKNQLTFEELSSLIKKKKSAKEKNSYTYSLLKEGVEKINRKVGEEALEVVIGSFIYHKNPTTKNRKELVGEFCDLFYHSLVLMAAQDVELKDIFEEFEKRNRKKWIM